MSASPYLAQQAVFARCLGSLLTSANQRPGVIVIPVEVGVLQHRKLRPVMGAEPAGATVSGSDAVHMPHSLHYDRMAADLAIYRDGALIADGDPLWDELGAFWKGLEPTCRWGGDFSEPDRDHYSVAWGGRQ